MTVIDYQSMAWSFDYEFSSGLFKQAGMCGQLPPYKHQLVDLEVCIGKQVSVFLIGYKSLLHLIIFFRTLTRAKVREEIIKENAFF